MTTNNMNQVTAESLMRKYCELAKKSGCVIVNLEATEIRPPYAYSIEFAQFKLPDIIIMGNLPEGMSTRLINDILAKWRKDGLKLGMDDKVIKGLDVNLELIPPSNELYNEYVRHAVEFYQIAPSAPSKSNELSRINLGGGERRIPSHYRH